MITTTDRTLVVVVLRSGAPVPSPPALGSAWVGAVVGEQVGAPVGALVGVDVVGLLVGTYEGDVVGEEDGEVVGLDVVGLAAGLDEEQWVVSEKLYPEQCEVSSSPSRQLAWHAARVCVSWELVPLHLEPAR